MNDTVKMDELEAVEQNKYDFVLEDWLEFRTQSGYTSIFRTQICVVEQINKHKTLITLINGKSVQVDEPYEKVMSFL